MALSSIASASSFFSLAFSSVKNLQAPGFGHVQATILGLPLVERRAADPVLAANIPRLQTRFLLPQDRNDPLFREPRLLHLRLPQGDGFYPFLEEVQGLRSDFKSTTDRLIVGVLKMIGLIGADGSPTERYFRFLDQTQSAFGSPKVFAMRTATYFR